MSMSIFSKAIISVGGCLFGVLAMPSALRGARNAYWERKVSLLQTYRKPKVLVVGTGWAAYLDRLIPSFFDVTVISPENFFLFTPLLTSTAVGTVESRSIVSPIRSILSRKGIKYICAKVEDVNINDSEITCRDNQNNQFILGFDYLILAVGAQVNTFNTPGVEENAFKLKKYADGLAIRKTLLGNLEQAAVPGISEKERRRLLTSVVVGGGPTGVEFAAELYDLLQEDITRMYSHSLVKDVKVILIQSADHILNTYDLDISKYAESLFARQGIQVLTNAKVISVNPTSVHYALKREDDEVGTDIAELPKGLCVWATGIKMNPLIHKLIQNIPEQQHNHALVVDDWMRVQGVPKQNIYALGDCATVRIPRVKEHFSQYFENHKENISLYELGRDCRVIERKHPELRLPLNLLCQLCKKYSQREHTTIQPSAFNRLIEETEQSLRTLPATAQVAQQEGRYLAKQFNVIGKECFQKSRLVQDVRRIADPFQYHPMGMAAYVGSRHAILDFGQTYLADRFLAYWLWRSIYLSEQVSLRTRMMIAFDWTKTWLFGRDISTPSKD